MKHISRIMIICSLAACASVPYTGRKQFNLLSSKQELKLGNQAYREVLKENKLSANQEWQQRVKAVGERIKIAAHQPKFHWEFNVLAGKQANAFCLPGGKVAFWEGIMPICGDDNGIAVVMGHEIAHAIAHHGAERMSQGMGVQIVANVLSVGLGNSNPKVRQGIMTSFGIGSKMGVMLPFGRKQESEGDKIGLILMAKAGYDPHAAVDFWQRMSKQGGKLPEFLSTHPSDKRRVDQIRKWLPKALKYYKPQ